MITKTASLLAIFLSSLLVGCVQKSIAPTSFSPHYQTQIDGAEVMTAKRCVSLSGVDVKNGLKNNIVGQRTLESSGLPAQNINLNGSPVAWVKTGSDTILKMAAINHRDPQGPRLHLTLEDVVIHENVHVNSGYDARVTIDAALVNSRGKECWRDSESGTSKNYGDSGSAVNYQETINHALDRAIMAVAADKGFQEAACGVCRN